MKLPLEPFLRSFVTLARGTEGAADLGEARRLARQLGGQATLGLAQKAALAVVDAGAEAEEARLSDRFVGGEAASGVVLEIWGQLQEKAGTRLPEPKMCSSGQVDLGAQAGNQVWLETGALEGDPQQLAFVMAHEMGHVAHRDSVRSAGIKLAVDLFATPAPLNTEARREIELEADGYAAALVGQMHCDSRPIVDRLLRLTAGSDHPDGLARAQVVRGFLPVADDVWLELLAKNQRYREISETHDRQEAALRKMMKQMR